MKFVFSLIISIFVLLEISHANNSNYEGNNKSSSQVGRYMISANGDYVIDTTTGDVRYNRVSNIRG